jgi:small subunit ribosomal protein S16
MVVRIRLARFGKRHRPFYNIVVAHARYVRPPCQSQPLAFPPSFNWLTASSFSSHRTARNSKPLEVLGTFDPLPQQPPRDATADARPTKAVQLDVSRAKYWLGVGAQPSDGAWELLEKVCRSLTFLFGKKQSEIPGFSIGG